jgi:hypothetical protein
MMLFSWRDSIGTPGSTDWSTGALEVEFFFDIIYYILQADEAKRQKPNRGLI